MSKLTMEDILEIILQHKNNEYDAGDWATIINRQGNEITDHNARSYLEKFVGIQLMEKSIKAKYRYRNKIFEKQVQIARTRDPLQKEQLKSEYYRLFLTACKFLAPKTYRKLELLAKMGITKFVEVEL